MPSSTLDDLADAYTQVSLINKRLLDEYEIVGQAFQRQGIECILLKGADLLSRLYGVRGTRPLSDVDLLVHEQDLPAIHRLLIETGFTQQIDGNPAYRLIPIHTLAGSGLGSLVSRRGGTCRAVGASSNSTARSADDQATGLRRPVTLSDRLLGRSPRASFPFLFHRSPIADREGIAPLAHARQGGNPTAPQDSSLPWPASLGIVNVTIEIPSTVLQQLAPSTMTEQILEFLFRRLVTTQPLPELGHFLLWITQPPGRRLAWLRRTLFPSSRFLAYRYGNESVKRPWHTTITRWWHLARAGNLLIARMLIRLIYDQTARTTS